MLDHSNKTPRKSLAFMARAALVTAAAAMPLLAATLPASAQLAFSPDCTINQAIAVVAPNDAILFSKHPVPHPNGMATVFSIIGLNNDVIPAGSNSCIIAAPAANDTYCFQARDDNTILQVGAQPIRNPGGLTALPVIRTNRLRATGRVRFMAGCDPMQVTINPNHRRSKMTKVSITLTGADKENVSYVLLGDKRWGLNGSAYGTQQSVDSGSQDWKVGFPKSEADDKIDVPDDATAVMTVDAKQDEVTVNF